MGLLGAEPGGGDPSTKPSGGTPYQPVPLSAHMGNRKTAHIQIKASGTTFVRAAADGTATNLWSRFPWEHQQFFTRAWEKARIPEEYLFWKCKKAHLQVKNPICIQDVGGSESGLATAGQNLHAQLFGYEDNLYTTGISTDIEQFTTAGDITNLLESWNQHGFSNAGTPINLPTTNINPNQFRYNYPDVKQCGMGGGNTIDYSWNIHSPYWRSTEQFQMSTAQGIDNFEQHGLVRWDEHFGIVQQLDNEEEVSLINAAQNLRAGPGTTGFRSWENVKQGSISDAQVWGLPKVAYHVSPDPMPKVWFQLQPQLGAIATGLSESICQVQFEVIYDIEMCGRAPSVMETDVTWLSNIGNRTAVEYANQWLVNFGKRIPLFTPIMRHGGNQQAWGVNQPFNKPQLPEQSRQVEEEEVENQYSDDAIVFSQHAPPQVTPPQRAKPNKRKGQDQTDGLPKFAKKAMVRVMEQMKK